MDLSVVVAVRNGERWLGAQLDALLAQDWDGDWEIVVVDNGSTDGTVELVERYAHQSDRLRLLHAVQRAGKSYAINIALTETTAAAAAFCDADDIVAERWVTAMAEGLRKHQVVTGPCELDLLNPQWLANSRGRSSEKPLGTFAGILPVARGNNYGVQRTVWARTGPLDENFSAFEDAEFSFRCWREGIDIVGLPDATVHYRYRELGRDLWRQGFAYGWHRPMIARLLIDAGELRPRIFGEWKSWLLLVVRLPAVVTRRGRARWLWLAGNRIGQAAGSVRHRTLML